MQTKVFSVIFISILFFSCSDSTTTKMNTSQPKEKEKKEEKVQVTREKKDNLIDKKEKAPPITSKEKPQKPKIEKEIDRLAAATRDILKQSLAYPKSSFSVRELSPSDSKWSPDDTTRKCEDLVSGFPIVFMMDDVKSNPNSSEKNGLYDGKGFCEYELKRNQTNAQTVVFRRNEGGHYSDSFVLVSASTSLNKIYHLPLASHFGKDGSEETITAELISKSEIKRTIIQRFGWKAADDRNGERQPRSETTQLFIIDENGIISLKDEQIVNHNFELFLTE